MKNKFLSLLTLSLVCVSTLTVNLQSVQAITNNKETQNIEKSNSDIEIINSVDTTSIKDSSQLKAIAYSNQPTLRRGDSGSAVKSMQSMLNYLSQVSNHKNHKKWNCGAADGKFGSATEKALKQYQRDAHLTADGICGPATWSALEHDFAYWE